MKRVRESIGLFSPVWELFALNLHESALFWLFQKFKKSKIPCFRFKQTNKKFKSNFWLYFQAGSCIQKLILYRKNKKSIFFNVPREGADLGYELDFSDNLQSMFSCELN